MKNEATVMALIAWLTQDSALPLYLMFVLIPVLAMLLAGLVIYAVFWKGASK